MKQYTFTIITIILLGTGTVFGGVVKDWIDTTKIANITTDSRNNISISKMVDGDNTCYISYTEKSGGNIISESISCVKTK